MPEVNLIFKFLIALALGACIGLERQYNEIKEENVAPQSTALFGVRTVSLVCLLGAIGGVLATKNPLLFGVLSASVFILVLISYVFTSLSKQDTGITTEIAIIYSYIIGFLVVTEYMPVQVTIALTVVLALILSQKAKIHKTVSGIQSYELSAFLSYGLIALVILPFLPNQSIILDYIPHFKEIAHAIHLPYDLLKKIEIINPFRLWLIVALITGVDMAGYFLERFIGKNKGILLTSFTAGFISSTATTQAIAQRSQSTVNINPLVSAALFANLASFLQIFVLIAPVNPALFVRILPMVISMIISALVLALMFYFSKKSSSVRQNSETAKEQTTAIFVLGPALKFAIIYLLIRFISKLAYEFFGTSGFLISIAFAAMTGLDAIVINIAELTGKTITPTTAMLALIIANMVNLATKSFYAFVQGNRDFAIKLSLSLLVIILSSCVGLFFIRA